MLILMAVIAFERKKTGTQKIKDNKLFWINCMESRTHSTK